MAGDGGRRRPRTRRGSPEATGAAVPSRVGRDDLAAYLAKLAAEMVDLARAADLHLLAYLADMTRLEAEQQARALRRSALASGASQASDTRPPGSR